eukprot:1185454-Prorocentrum_minimum.AAC.2
MASAAWWSSTACVASCASWRQVAVSAAPLVEAAVPSVSPRVASARAARAASVAARASASAACAPGGPIRLAIGPTTPCRVNSVTTLITCPRTAGVWVVRAPSDSAESVLLGWYRLSRYNQPFLAPVKHAMVANAWRLPPILELSISS